MNDSPPMEWSARLEEFYRELDRELEDLGAVCDGCGECCHFDKVDHVLYASRLERLHLARAAELPLHPDATPELLAAGLRCPYQSGGRCLAREGRVLGCRLHFCSWPARQDENDFAERWHAKLKELHDTLGVGWDYRPLLPWPADR